MIDGKKKKFFGALKGRFTYMFGQIGATSWEIDTDFGQTIFWHFLFGQKRDHSTNFGIRREFKDYPGSWHPYRSAVLAWEKRRHHAWLI